MKQMKSEVQGNSFEWRKLAISGANGVAKELQLKPQVISDGEKGNGPMSISVSVCVEKYNHQFLVESSRFHYLRENGKARHFFKEFDSLRS